MTNPVRPKKSLKEIRLQHNRELIRRMEAGEPLNSFDSNASWYPPRPVLEKDPDAISRLYGSGTNQPTAPQSVLDLAQKLNPVKSQRRKAKLTAS